MYNSAHMLKSDVSGPEMQIYTGYCKTTTQCILFSVLQSVNSGRKNKQQFKKKKGGGNASFDFFFFFFKLTTLACIKHHITLDIHGP